MTRLRRPVQPRPPGVTPCVLIQRPKTQRSSARSCSGAVAHTRDRWDSRAVELHLTQGRPYHWPNAPNDVLTLISAQTGRRARTLVGAGEVAQGGVSGLPDNGNVAVARARGQLRPERPDRGLASKFED
jgi:hypothetical protein